MKKKKALVFFSNAIGDAFTIIPTVRAIERLFKEMTFVCPESLYFIFNDISFEKVEFFDNPIFIRGETLENKIWDCFISLSTDDHSFINWALENLECKLWIGYWNEQFDFNFADQQCEINMFDQYYRILNFLGAKERIEDFSYPAIPIKTKISAIFEQYNYPIISIHTDTKKEKEWNYTKFDDLIKKIVQNYPNYMIVILGNPSFDFASHDRIIQVPNADFIFVWEALNHSRLLIGLDSCFKHIADLNRIPSIILFGQSSQAEWGFRFCKSGEIIQPTSKNLDDISVNQVMKLVDLKLASLS